MGSVSRVIIMSCGTWTNTNACEIIINNFNWREGRERERERERERMVFIKEKLTLKTYLLS